MSAYLSRGVEHPGTPAYLLASMTETEKDEIAGLLLEVVRYTVERKHNADVYGLDRNIRPEPPEARLGFMPRSAA